MTTAREGYVSLNDILLEELKELVGESSLVVRQKVEKMDKKALNEALKTSLPVILGYLPSGFAFGLMMSSLGQKVITSGIMAILMYAGAGQYIAVDFIKNNSPLITIIVTTFLINCKHLFYGLSLIETFNKTGRKKPCLLYTSPSPRDCS